METFINALHWLSLDYNVFLVWGCIGAALVASGFIGLLRN